MHDEKDPKALCPHCLTPTTAPGDAVVVPVPMSHPRQLRKMLVAEQSPAGSFPAWGVANLPLGWM